MNKKVIALLTIVVLVCGVFSGCTQSVTNKPDTTADTTSTQEEQGKQEKKDVSLVFWSYSRWAGINGTESDGESGDWERSLVKKYEEQNPGVHIEFEQLPFNGGPQKVNVAIASNTQPDILQDGTMRGLGYASRGLLVPLDEYFTDEELSDFTGAINLGRHPDGKLYEIVWGNLSFGLLVNVDLFRKAGALDLLPQNEEKSWNYDQFKEALRAVSKDGVYGIGLFAGNEQGDTSTFSYIRGKGAEFFNDTQDKVLYNTPEAIAGIESLKSLLDEGLAVPGAETMLSTDVDELFRQQKIATCLSSSAGYGGAKLGFEKGDYEPFELEMVQLPREAGVDPGFYFGGTGIMVFKSGDPEKEKEAVEFAKYMSSAENIKHFCKITAFFPSRKSTGNIFEGDKIMEWLQTQAGYCIDPGFAVEGYAEIRGAFYPALQAVYAGTKTAQQAMDEFVAKANEIIKNNKK